jgi:GMP synthase (glutamine-hydrolysing)
MNPIAVLTHVDRADVGLVAEAAHERGHALRVVRSHRGDRLPDFDQIAALVVLGGPQSADDDLAYLREEERYLADAMAAGVPILAICLGAQLLSRAAGGSAQPGETGVEAGMITVRSTEGATVDVAGEYFSFHSDSMTPPPGADVIAASDRYPQAWTAGSALAIQFHPEITMRGIEALLAIEGRKLERFGVDVDKLRRDAERYFADGADDARRVLGHWFDHLSA